MSSTIVTGSYRQSDTTRCLPKQGIISAQLTQITGKVKQKNGKENTIIRLNRTMERKIVITHNYQEYILLMGKQNMAYRVGEQVPDHSDKEARINQDVTHTMVFG